MYAYIARRLLLMIPTLLGVLLINFVIVQFAPGGPIEQVMSQVEGTADLSTSRFSGVAADEVAGDSRGGRGLDPEFVAELEAQFGFDRPAHERFFKMVVDYAQLDFGESFLPGRIRRRAHRRQIACVGLPWPLDAFFYVFDLHTVGYPQSGPRWLCV